VISGDITVARLLDEHPELLEVLASYHPHFRQFGNKLLRRVMAPRVTVAQAARIAGVSADDLVDALRRSAGEVDSTREPSRSASTARGSEAEGHVDAPVFASASLAPKPCSTSCPRRTKCISTYGRTSDAARNRSPRSWPR
jgi:uncharacterized protein DUF1858